jgi:hypothetical protein
MTTIGSPRPPIYHRVETSVRPARVASLIPDVDDWIPAAQRMIELFSRAWGGRGDILVPTSDDGTVSDDLWRLLERFDPDRLGYHLPTHRGWQMADPAGFERWLDQEAKRWTGMTDVASPEEARRRLLDPGVLRMPLTTWEPPPALEDRARQRLAPLDPSGDKVVLDYVTGAVELWNGDEKAQPQRLQESGISVQEVIIAPDDATAPALVAIEVTGQIRVWNLEDPSHGSTFSGSFPHSLTMGSLRGGGRYLAVGRNNGADLWRLDEVRHALEEDGLHDNDAQRVVLLDRSNPIRFVTAGDDGWLRVWNEADGRPRRSLAIPTGYPSDLTSWRTDGGEERIAVTAAHLLRIYDASSGELRLERELSAPGRLSYLDLPGGGLLAVADRQQVHVIDTATGDVRSHPVPDRPGTEESRPAAARNVVALCWAPSAGSGQVLVAGTQGGMLVSWVLDQKGAAQEPKWGN